MSPNESRAADFTYTPLDHDQRNTLNVGFGASLPSHIRASTNVNYGSGFTNGSPNEQYSGAYLPEHTTFRPRGKQIVRGEDNCLYHCAQCRQPQSAARQQPNLRRFPQ